MLICPCGEPVSTLYHEESIRLIIEEVGEMKVITTPQGSWLVPTIHVLVHGVVATELPASSYEKVEK